MRADTSAIAIVAAGSLMLGCQGDSTNGPSPSDGGDAALLDAKAADATFDGARAEGGTADAAGDATGDATSATSDAASGADTGKPMDAAIAESASDAGIAGAIRVANWSSDAPALDFCLAAHGSNIFQGPVMKGKVQVQEAGAVAEAGVAGLTFPQVSSYTLVGAGQYDVRLVVAGAVDCSVPVVDDATMPPASAPSTPVTVALVGTGSLRKVIDFADEASPGKPANIAVRLIHAASGIGPLSFGTGDVTGSFTALFAGVQFAQASLPATAPGMPDGGAGATADSNGYLQRSPLTTATLSARLSTTTQDSGAPTQIVSTSNFSAAAGAVVTFAVVGTNAAPQLLRCFDNAGRTASDLYSDCVIAQP